MSLHVPANSKKKVFLILMFPVPYIISMFLQNLTYLFRCSREINVPVLLPTPRRASILEAQGGYSHFSSYVGSDPASTVHPPPPPKKKKNIRNFKHPPIEILATQKKYPPFCTLILRKDPKMHRNEPQI